MGISFVGENVTRTELLAYVPCNDSLIQGDITAFLGLAGWKKALALGAVNCGSGIDAR